MAETIESFVAKLQAEGVQAGREAAEQLEAKARQKAEEIGRQAEAKARDPGRGGGPARRRWRSRRPSCNWPPGTP